MDVQGIPQLDAFLPFVYPWFMVLLFLLAGISARYSLSKRTDRVFAGDRAKRILVPGIAGIFILGWIAGVITMHYAPVLGENPEAVPLVIKYIIACLIGIGPLWFAHELFIICMFLLLLRALDKGGWLWKLGGRTSLIVMLLLFFPMWGASQIGNLPYVTVYRFGIYPLAFLLGYYVFSHKGVTEKLKRLWLPFGVAALALGVWYTVVNYGQNYAEPSLLKNWFTNLYVWIAVLALLACGQRFLDFENRFTRYMTKNNFSFYVLHYPVIVGTGFLAVEYASLPFIFNYIIVLTAAVVLVPLLIEVIKRIPVLRFLLLGIVR